ncbi:MAG: hypothetical protein ACJAVM_003002 [Sulfitobacter sp.]|jgi:hypothetical protein
MKILKYSLLAAMMAFGGPVLAQDTPVVVELYTSQGCSSCPAADQILHELAEREDVIALALHVDYWDYIGWKDTFATPAHAERQRAYAAAGHRRSIYTPEMIVQGQTDIVGAKPMALSKAIAEHARQSPKVAVTLARAGGTLHITAEALSKIKGKMTVHLLRYMPSETTHIKRGENAGKTVSYANIVTGWTVLGHWDGTAALDMTAPVTGDMPTVVIIQSADTGPILAAARVR